MERPNGPRWHNERRRRLVQEHPEVRALVGPNPWTAVLVVSLVVVQLGIAAALQHSPLWVMALTAYLLGAVLSHALGVLIHDCAHDLAFRSGTANRILALVANIPFILPATMDFRDKHLVHHAHLGAPDGSDTQAPHAWDFTFVTSRWRAFIWHGFGPALSHSANVGVKPANRHWLRANALVQIAVTVLIVWLIGFQAAFYLLLSSWLAFGPHPLGARRYGEHLTLAPAQPTNSYYGPYNWVSFDVGYHVEHHDLPSVPWNRLRALHDMAPELYQPLASIESWNALIWQLFTRNGEGPKRYYFEREPRFTARDQRRSNPAAST